LESKNNKLKIKKLLIVVCLTSSLYKWLSQIEILW